MSSNECFLCTGAASDIFIIRDPLRGSQRVRKVMRISPAYFQQDSEDRSLLSAASKEFYELVKCWATLRHKNVAQLEAPVAGSYLFELTCAHYPHSDLRNYLQKQDSSCPTLKTFIGDIVNGLEYLHSQVPPIVHGNINAGKIFIDTGGIAKIGEFGLAAFTMPFPDLVPSISHAGLVRWMGPELFQSDKQVGKPTIYSDVWALGCTILEIVTRKLPYSKYKHDAKITQKILEGELPGSQSEWQSPSKLWDNSFGRHAIWNIINQCWVQPSTSRPSCATLLQQHTPVAYLDFHPPTNDPTPVPQQPANSTRDTKQRYPYISTAHQYCIGNLNKKVEKIDVGPAARRGAVTVWRGHWVDTSRREILAIKVLIVDRSVSQDALEQRLGQEMQVWNQLSHKNILELYGSIVDPVQFGDSLPALVTPWCNHGSLGDLLKTNQGTLDRSLRYNIIRDFTDGLHYMHTNPGGPVMHGDLKSATIFIADEFVAKIGDFGLSRTVKTLDDNRTLTVVSPGTLRWMTPEALSEYAKGGVPDPLNSATDIWAWGHLVYETVTGRMPYSQYPSNFSAARAIMDGKINHWPAEDDLSTDTFLVSIFWSILEKCWAFDPKERPRITEIVRMNPFISGSSKQNDDMLQLRDDPASFNSALRYKKQADVAFRQQAYQQALDYYEKSRQLFERMGDQARHAKALQDVAWTYIHLGKHINMARNCIIQAHEIFQKIGDIEGQLDAIQDLAIVERADRNLVQARNHLDSAYYGCRKAGLHIRSGWCLVAIGLLDVDIEDWEAAHRCFNAATEIAVQERDQGLSGRSRERQGDCYMRQGMRPQARRCYDDAARAYRSLPKEEDQVDRVERKIQGCHHIRHQNINSMPPWSIGNLQNIDQYLGPHSVRGLALSS